MFLKSISTPIQPLKGKDSASLMGYRWPGLLQSEDAALLESSSSRDVALDPVLVRPPGDAIVSLGLSTCPPAVDEDEPPVPSMGSICG